MKRYDIRIITRSGAEIGVLTGELPDEYTKEQALTAILQPFENQKNAEWLRSGEVAVQVRHIEALIVKDVSAPAPEPKS